MFGIAMKVLIGAALLFIPLAASANEDLDRLSQDPVDWAMRAHQMPYERSPTLRFVPDRDHVKYWAYPR